MASVLRATNKAIRAAKHLTDEDAGAVEVLRDLARKIDAWDQIVQYAIEDLAGRPKGARPMVPIHDNTSMPTYLKFCEQLGLTPLGRHGLHLKPVTEQKPVGKLAKVTALRGGKVS